MKPTSTRAQPRWSFRRALHHAVASLMREVGILALLYGLLVALHR